MSPVSVVLPDPDGPTRARVSPAPIVSDDVAQHEPVRRVPERHAVELDPRRRPRASVGRPARRRWSGGESMISKTRAIAPVPSRNWPYSPAIVPRLAAIATPYSRNPVSVPIPSSPAMTWCPVYQSRPARAPNPRSPISAPNSARHRARREPGRDDAPQVRVVAIELPVLADVALDHADARQRLLGGRRAPRDRVLDLGADLLERPAEHDRDRDQGGRQQQDDEQQRRAEGEQDDDRADEADDRRQQARDRLGQHRPDERHVARQPRHELPDPRRWRGSRATASRGARTGRPGAGRRPAPRPRPAGTSAGSCRPPGCRTARAG